MSQYETLHDTGFWRYGWDQPLQSYFLQMHDVTKPEDEQIVVWLGASETTKMYEVEDLVREAKTLGLKIPYPRQVQLVQDKDEGR